jgi:hypothetical protein
MYLWAVSIDGDQTVKGVDVDLDVPFSDIFDNLNGTLKPCRDSICKIPNSS